MQLYVRCRWEELVVCILLEKDEEEDGEDGRPTGSESYIQADVETAPESVVVAMPKIAASQVCRHNYNL